jgi:hypothetical protein
MDEEGAIHEVEQPLAIGHWEGGFGAKMPVDRVFSACQDDFKPTATDLRRIFQTRKQEIGEIMENRISTILEESAESRKSDALPMSEILEELFIWCQARFPELTIAATEMSCCGIKRVSYCQTRSI